MNTLHLLKNIKIPIYIVWGDNSRLNNTIENMNKIREIRPDIDYFIFEERVHILIMKITLNLIN